MLTKLDTLKWKDSVSQIVSFLWGFDDWRGSYTENWAEGFPETDFIHFEAAFRRQMSKAIAPA